MSLRLRDMIKGVRACKTAAEERACVSKECANIRSSFREEENGYRHRNMAKLLYIHMLGYPTNWGQMECLKLIASASYSDKRIGYLGLMVLMDENQEILMLVTNHMKNDLNHANQFVAGLALCALGNISSSSIARDLAPEVEKLLAHSNPYLRKKAALAAIRILRKCPDLMENFVPRIRALLNERNHGVLLTGITLMLELCENDVHNIEFFRRLVPTLVRILKNLVMSGYAPEYDVSGVTDPFLQVKILRLLRLLGKEDTESSDVMNDILAQVATNTDHTRNVGNSILYECVNTIMSIEAEGGLRVLAINVLGRFLQNRDNNIRYVALSTLSKVVNADLEAVQRHRNTIVDCLKDPDVSIRKRALDLIYALVNESNIKILAHELLNFLQGASPEFRSELTDKLCNVTQRFAPNKRWHVDTILRVMSIAGEYIPDEVSANLVSLVASSPELHSYAVQRMYVALTTDMNSQVLAQVAVWCIGEFGDLLVANKGNQEPDAITVSENDVIELLEKLLKFTGTSATTREYILTALMKLTTRFSSGSTRRLQEIIQQHMTNMDVEMQQRACEYAKLFNFGNITKQVLERIPIQEERAAVAPPEIIAHPKKSDQPIMIDFGEPISPTVGNNNGHVAVPAATSQTSSKPYDPLAEIFGDLPVSSTPNQPALTPSLLPNLGLESLLGPSMSTGPSVGASLLGPTMTPAPVAARAPLNGPLPSYVGFQKNGITGSVDVVKQASHPNITAVTFSFVNSNPGPVTNFEFKAAVPKYIKMQVSPPSGDSLAPNGGNKVTQQLKLLNTNHGEKPVLLKMKLDFVFNGAPASEIADITFPEGV
eukprot:TRINITY_DN2653_c0_g1_i1.p1 TRINITY_DN2653_c0_g1~~TRINITY_DN2653_c0_g1_i1.p1  ORF type:complete len:828 (+),score=234.87 TRINITY_DN2653_c0_g1_i1:127-2610(+)